MFARGTAILTAAAICAGGFALMTQPSASEGAQAPTTKITDRHPGLQDQPEQISFALRGGQNDGNTLAESTTAAPKSGMQLALDNCAGETWPRISASCLEGPEGNRVNSNVRTVSLTENYATNTTIATRIPTTVTAAR